MKAKNCIKKKVVGSRNKGHYCPNLRENSKDLSIRKRKGNCLDQRFVSVN